MSGVEETSEVGARRGRLPSAIWCACTWPSCLPCAESCAVGNEGSCGLLHVGGETGGGEEWPMEPKCFVKSVRQERHSERNVWLGWCKIAEKEGFVDDVECSAAAWFFEIGGHAPDGVDF